MSYDIRKEPVEYSFLGLGESVTTNTVRKMIDTIKVSSKNLRLIKRTQDIVAMVPAKDQVGEVTTVYNWVRDHTRYIKDPHGTEMIQSPLVALDQIADHQLFQGDCDDLTIITLSMLRSIGYPVAIRIADYRGQGVYTHVYGLVKIYNEWTPIEPIKLRCPLGWEAPGAFSVRDFEVL